ncbi:MAG: molecular chaperone TorD family protein [Myxococcota bacterium]
MTAETIDGLAGRAEVFATERSRAYYLFATALGYPEGDLHAAIRSGELADGLRGALDAVDPAIANETDWTALRDAGDADDDLAIEFTRLFDAGSSGPPCPLCGGLYGGTRMKTMEESVRFYNHFGLKLSGQPRELPDHLTTQLEFLHFLCFREAQCLQRDDDPGPYCRAQRDFVARHPGCWVPKLRERLDRNDPADYFRELIRLLERFLIGERERMVRELGEVEAAAPSPAAPS